MMKRIFYSWFSLILAAAFVASAGVNAFASAAGVTTINTQLKTGQIKSEAAKCPNANTTVTGCVQGAAMNASNCKASCEDTLCRGLESCGTLLGNLFSGLKSIFTKVVRKVSDVFNEVLGIFGIGKNRNNAQAENGRATSGESVPAASAKSSSGVTTGGTSSSSSRIDPSNKCDSSDSSNSSETSPSGGRIIDNSNGSSNTSDTDASDLSSAATGTSSVAVSAAGIPKRASDAIGGRAFYDKVKSMSLTDYDKAVKEEILKGNIPDFLRNFKEVKVNFKGGDGKQHAISYFVMPDYLAIGSNDDFMRVPMTPMAAQAIADKFGCTLPTKKMVDDIYAAATVKLNPQPIDVSKGISKISNFYEHQKMVETQRSGKPLGALTAGDQKDVVITNLLDQAAQKGKKQVAIYGWHQKNGKAIQPLSTIHNYYHVDYSHGVRMVQNTVVVDGVERPIGEVLADRNLAAGLSAEGTIKNTKAHR